MKWVIVTPFLNAAPFLDRSVTASLSALDGHDGTLLLVDDGSTDAGPAIAREWSRRDTRVVVRSTGGPQGPGPARNLGLADVDDGWVAFVDADDYLVPGALDRIASAISDHPDSDLVHHTGRGCETVTGTESRTAAGDLNTEVDLPAQRDRYLMLRTEAPTWRISARRQLLGDVPFRHGVHEDVDAVWNWWRSAVAARSLDADLLAYRPAPGSVMQTMSRAHVDGFVDAWSAVGRDIESAHGPPRWARLHDLGAVAVLAVLARGIIDLAADEDQAAALLVHLHDRWTAAFAGARGATPVARPTTYSMAAELLLGQLDGAPSSRLDRARKLIGPLDDLLRSRWTCRHLRSDPQRFELVNAGLSTDHDACPELTHGRWTSLPRSDG